MNGHVRIVRCPSCPWLTILPASLESDAALEVGRGLAKLHLQNAHRERAAAEPADFSFENFETTQH